MEWWAAAAACARLLAESAAAADIWRAAATEAELAAAARLLAECSAAADGLPPNMSRLLMPELLWGWSICCKGR